MNHYRILFFTSSLRIGGAERHLLNLCRWLRSAGHECAVCTTSAIEDGLEKSFLDESITIFRLPLRSLRSLPSPRVVSGLRRIGRDFRPHLIHAHLFHGEVAAAFASMVLHVPLIATRHSAGLEFRGWRRHFSRAIAPRFSECIAVSREAAEEAFSTGYRRGNVVVIPNAVDPGRYRPIEGHERERRRTGLVAELFPGCIIGPFVLIGSAGGLKPVKNFPLMLRCAARLLAARPRCSPVPELRFVIFGEGGERESLETLSRSLGIDSCFSFPGARENLESLYSLLDIFVLPSLSEGLPMALLEAMSSGVACVASDVGGVGEVLADAGRLEPSGDDDAFTASLRDLAMNEDKRKELGRRSRVRILERYNVDIWGERTLSVYESAIGHRSRP
ncbi:MAG: glycosyltransferase [Candidatus Krumholzibacteria bacterium]|nr:glycosyltransferase [Candidatus Krumholzibacteria bacterium]